MKFARSARGENRSYGYDLLPSVQPVLHFARLPVAQIEVIVTSITFTCLHAFGKPEHQLVMLHAVHSSQHRPSGREMSKKFRRATSLQELEQRSPTRKRVEALERVNAQLRAELDLARVATAPKGEPAEDPSPPKSLPAVRPSTDLSATCSSNGLISVTSASLSISSQVLQLSFSHCSMMHRCHGACRSLLDPLQVPV